MELYPGVYASVPSGVTPEQRVFLTWDIDNLVWSGTISNIPLGTTYTFVGRAYDSPSDPVDIADAIPANETFNGFAVAALSNSSAPLILALSPLDDGNGILLPSIDGIYVPTEIGVGKQTSIQFDVGGQAFETVDYALFSSGGIFTPLSGSLTLDDAGSGMITVSYTAPATVNLYNHSVTVTNNQGNSVTQGFSTDIVLTVTNGEITVQFAPVITAINAVRSGSQLSLTATVTDDVLPLDITYNWGFSGTGPSGIGISGTTATGTLQPYDQTATGTIYLTVTDEGGAGNFTQISFDVPYFPDNPVILLKDVALFANTAYVQYDATFADTTAGASNLEKSLTLLGYTLNTFTGITAAEIQAAIDRRSVLAISKLELADLSTNLSGNALTAIRSFVQDDGGTLLLFGSASNPFAELLVERLFGYAILGGGTILSPIDKNATAAEGTAFAQGPTQLSVNSTLASLVPSSLPSGARTIYTDADGNSVVTLIPHGSGKIVVLGWDWDDARPTGTQDGGWLKMLDAASGGVVLIQLGATDRGWWTSEGYHTGTNQNTQTGSSEAMIATVNSFFQFPMQGITGQVETAFLKLELAFFDSPDASESFSIWDTNTDAVSLDSNGGGTASDIAIFQDLQTGVSYANATATSADMGTIFEIPLSPQAVIDANAAGRTFALGATLDNIGQSALAEYINFSTGFNGDFTHQLDLRVSQQSVPPQLQVDVFYQHACLVDKKGVQCWGRNQFGQTDVPALSNPRQVVTGAGHSCALDDTGVVCWGNNIVGQIFVPGLTNPRKIEAGNNHTCALDDFGLFCWGTNTNGQLNVPTLIAPRQFSASVYTTCALDDTGVQCWGSNAQGQTSVPTLVAPIQVSAGRDHTCALDATGVVCWGYNGAGQTNVPLLSNPTQLSAGINHSCALDDTGVVCWGFNGSGQTSVPTLVRPTQIVAGADNTCAVDIGVVCWGSNIYGQAGPLMQVSSGNSHTCRLDSSGVMCWGYGLEGQTSPPALTNPRKISSSGFTTCALDDNGVACWGRFDTSLITPPALSAPTEISGSDIFACALDATGVVCWGDNTYGQTTLPALTNPTRVDVGFQFACALDNTEVKCWGRNDFGQTTVPALTNPVELEVGGWHACALDDTGVVCWGRSDLGQTNVPSLTNPTLGEAGNANNCALDDTGVVCWGWNSSGQNDVPILYDPRLVSSGGGHTCVSTSVGIRCWGLNSDGQTDTP